MPLRGQLPEWNPDRLTIKQAPAPRDVYWIGVFSDSLEPEFTGYHPGIIIRGAQSLDVVTQTVTFVPLTTAPPRTSPATGKVPPYIYQLSRNPNPRSADPIWAVCNHIITTRLTRLERYFTDGGLTVVKVSKDDFTGIMKGIRSGFGALENHIKTVIEQEKTAYKAALDAEHAARLAKIEAEIERRAEERVFAQLDELTKPKVAPSP